MTAGPPAQPGHEPDRISCSSKNGRRGAKLAFEGRHAARRLAMPDQSSRKTARRDDRTFAVGRVSAFPPTRVMGAWPGTRIRPPAVLFLGGGWRCRLAAPDVEAMDGSARTATPGPLPGRATIVRGNGGRGRCSTPQETLAGGTEFQRHAAGAGAPRSWRLLQRGLGVTSPASATPRDGAGGARDRHEVHTVWLVP